MCCLGTFLQKNEWKRGIWRKEKTSSPKILQIFNRPDHCQTCFQALGCFRVTASEGGVGGSATSSAVLCIRTWWVCPWRQLPFLPWHCACDILMSSSAWRVGGKGGSKIQCNRKNHCDYTTSSSPVLAPKKKPPVPGGYSIVDSGCSQHLTATTAGLVDVTSCGGEVETAAAGQSLSIVGRGSRPGVPGTTYVVENLSEDLVSFNNA